jgi:hypothetical protein
MKFAFELENNKNDMIQKRRQQRKEIIITYCRDLQRRADESFDQRFASRVSANNL